jgi:ubiquinone/menaquinone biosynthesis C-methylase UbiE
MNVTSEKQAVKDFWNDESCGERYMSGGNRKAQLEAQAAERYRLEPYIHTLLKFDDAKGKDVLEIGVGMGADHMEIAKAAPLSLTGVDLTERAVAHTTDRLSLAGFTPNVRVADAEELPFPAGSFDLVYSHGVLHCSPDTEKAFREVFRVLRPGGTARIMIYNSRSLVGYMLWVRYALLKGKPFQSIRSICTRYLESPGTKAYTASEARQMFHRAGFSAVQVMIQLTFGDLLEGGVGARHKGALLTLAKALYPRWFIRRFMKGCGMGMYIDALKPTAL